MTEELDSMLWLMFMFLAAVLPIKTIFRQLLGLNQLDTQLYLQEETESEWHHSQLYRPGDRKYERIARLARKAKSVNELE
jgi:cell division protein FtsL